MSKELTELIAVYKDGSTQSVKCRSGSSDPIVNFEKFLELMWLKYPYQLFHDIHDPDKSKHASEALG